MVEGSVLGTAAYMSPEQAEGKTLDERTDVFSLGALLYEMPSGNRAFGVATTAQVLNSVHHEPAPLQVSPDIERIVRRCLAKGSASAWKTCGGAESAQGNRWHSREPRRHGHAPSSTMSADK